MKLHTRGFKCKKIYELSLFGSLIIEKPKTILKNFSEEEEKFTGSEG